MPAKNDSEAIEEFLSWVDGWAGDEAKNGLEQLKPYIHAHWDLAKGSRTYTGIADDGQRLGQIAEMRHLRPGYLRRPVAEMRNPARAHGVRSERVSVPLVGHKDFQQSGFMAHLALELLEGGQGELFPSPAASLLSLDERFRQSFQNAQAFVRKIPGVWPEKYDVCWTLQADQCPWRIEGDSAGLGLTMAMGRLLATSTGAA